ncbi:MAG: CDP-diacylglycerol--glycerol-3-phosphate 3-phosphatidyltransferase [Rhodospirillaceae bacterium]|nr:CDP-diacylglycerol--glycerol-3-phosphate 3-phosphatidyltransferase [Rhodospirillaceae bacterium]
MRVGLVPVVAGVMMIGGPAALLVAAVLFAVASATDWLDGYAARRLNAESDLGRMLDPIADKLLVVTVLVMLVALDRIAGTTVVAALVIMLREFLIGGVREFLAGIGSGGLKVTQIAKLKTAVQMVALVLLMLAGVVLPDLPLMLVGEVLLWASAALAAVSGADYVRKAAAQLRARAAARSA